MPTLLISHADAGGPPHHALVRKDDSESTPGLLRSLGSPTSDNLPKLKGPFLGSFTQSTSGSDLNTCDVNITPDCLRALYNIHYIPLASKKNSFGIG